MLEATLRSIIEHRHRHWIVITVIALIAVVFGWPAVDNYLAASAQRAEFQSQLDAGSEIQTRLEMYRKKLESKETQVKAAEAVAMTEQHAQELRSQLVQRIREAGCTLRRIRLSDPIQRDWFENDNPLSLAPKAENNKKTPFKLRTRTMSLTLGGDMTGVIGLLSTLSEHKSLMKTSRFALKRSNESEGQVELELDLLLFELVRGNNKT